jgi:hypothetical protein
MGSWRVWIGFIWLKVGTSEWPGAVNACRTVS